MHSRLVGRSGGGSRRVAAMAAVGACGVLIIALGADAAANRSFIADAPAHDSPEAQQAPANSSSPGQPESVKESDRSGKPQRRQRIRDEGAEDELQSRSRLLLASLGRGAGAPA